jgi:ABC-2 type transport system ATP-binding protein
VEGLCRSFGPTTAVDDISFRVGKGEVVGFLGPNGAGKTTTMRMICGCIGATQGQIQIDGQDIMEAPHQIKARIGYLPETPPLYRTMSVQEYVAFAARIQGVTEVESATETVLSQVGLMNVRERVIGHLSKGYRQRVGLAQALVHDPELLILDEPGSGLDPAQRVEIRELLLELAAGKRTVILSTHILSEVEAVCERVLIINQGQLVADEALKSLGSGRLSHRIELARPSDRATAILETLDGVVEVEELNHSLTSFRVLVDSDIREVLALTLAPLGLVELRPETSLEQIYLRHTRELTG